MITLSPTEAETVLRVLETLHDERRILPVEDVLRQKLRRLLPDDPEASGKHCAHCGSPFSPHNAQQIYCHPNCGKAARNKKLRERRQQDGLCTRCGKRPLDSSSYCRECMREINALKKESEAGV